MKWEVVYIPEALKDLKSLDGSQALLIRKAIKKVSGNPLPTQEGGYGHLLANRQGTQLSGFLKIKLRSAGLRVVYKLERIDDRMVIIVIGARADDEVYDQAEKRRKKYNL